MSLIETQSVPAPAAVGVINFAGDAAFDSISNYAASGVIVFSSSAAMARVLSPGAVGEIEFAATATARLNNEPNVFPSATANIAFVSSATMKRRIKPYAAGTISFSATATASVTEAENSSLQLIVDIVPIATVSRTLQQSARLTIDGANIPLRSFQYSEPRRAVGANLTVRLARLSDRAAITRNSTIKFELGRKISGVWQWKTKFDSGELSGKDYSIGWAANAPTDTLSIRAAGDLNKKLSRTPATDLIFYNPAKMTLNADDFEPIYDTSGRAYNTQLIPVGNLSLHFLFQAIFADRCGFDSFETNIPNYQISRADFGFGSGYLSGIAPLVGMFEPVFYVISNTLWILDTSAVLPPGFPLPRSITPADYRGLNLAENHSKLDAYRLVFSESDSAWDYFTTRLEQKSKETGTFGSTDFTRTESSRTIREYRKLSAPALIVKTDVRDETRSTYDYQLNLISRTISQYFYDSFGRQTRVQKLVEGLVPNFEAEGNPLQLLLINEETSLTTYAAHPFEPRRQFQKTFVRQIRGLLGVDSENEYLGKPFAQDFRLAHRAGDLSDGITTTFGAIKTITQTARPQRDGTVEMTTEATDFTPTHVGNPPISLDPVTEVLAGDVSLNGSASKQSQIVVFETDDETMTDESKVEAFNVGELPLAYAKPLARRRLKKQKNKPGNVGFDLIGFDDSIERGTILTATGRGAENLGAFLIEGLNISGDEKGIISETLDAQQI